MQRLRNARFGYVLKHVQDKLRHAMDEELADAELTTPQYAALTALEREAGLSNAELARRCFVTPQTMHSIVTRLEKQGLLRRSSHPTHGRKQQIHLTDDGQARLEEGHEIVERIEGRMTQAVSQQEVRQAKEVLITCAHGLEST